MWHQQRSLGGIQLADGLESLRKLHHMYGALEGMAGKLVSVESN